MSTQNPLPKTKGPVINLGLCRCCGFLKKCRLLNVEYEFMGQKEVYSDMITDCFNLVLSHLDGKPTDRLLCATCITQLRQAIGFRRQVLICEEAFMQLRMHKESKEDNDQTTWPLSPALGVEVQVNAIKSEDEALLPADDCGEDSLLSDRDVLAGSDHEQTCYNTFEAIEEIEYRQNIELPDSKTHRANRAYSNNSQKQPTPEYDSNDDLPISRLAKDRNINTSTDPAINRDVATEKSSLHVERKPLKLKLDRKCKRVGRDLRIQRSRHKQKDELPIPMKKLQQIIREKDTTYLQAINLLTIIEYSYVCPFKCRHNNLLCYYCGQLCPDPASLRTHTITEHDPKKFKNSKIVKADITRIDCRLCSERIDSLDRFKIHISSVHKKKYYFDQSDSILPFVLNGECFKCTFCSEKFLYFHALNKHMNVHFNNYVCETCGLGFVDQGRFLMHLSRHEEGDYPCETCGKAFRAEYNRDLHIDRVHKKKGRVYCPKCDIKLMSYPQKMKHLQEVHGDQPLSFSCDLCDKVCSTRRMLTIHRRKEHLKDFRYECQYCGQRFFTRFALTNHIPTHTGERNFKCKVCDKTYPRLKTLKDHIRIHNNDRRYRCHVCGQAFIQNCSLKGHLKSQHPDYI